MNKKNIIIFILVFIFHFILQFLSWSFAPGNAAVTQQNLISKLWPIVSFPIFSVVPKDLIGQYFWLSSFINSTIWALFGVGFLRILFKSK